MWKKPFLILTHVCNSGQLLFAAATFLIAYFRVGYAFSPHANIVYAEGAAVWM